jgi:GTP pyrophosphokinase
MTDILTYLYQDEDALVKLCMLRARKSIISLTEIEQKFGKDISTQSKDTLAMGKLSEIIESNKTPKITVNNQRDHYQHL